MTNTFSRLFFLGLLMVLVGCSGSQYIKKQDLKMSTPKGSQTFQEELLKGEIAGTKIEHFTFVGSFNGKFANYKR